MCDSPFDLPPADPPPPSRAGLSPERGVGVIPLARLQVAQWLSKSSLRRLQIRHTQLPLPPPDAVWNVRAAAPEESPRPTSSCCSCAKTGSGQVIILPRQAVSGRPKPNATNVQNRKNLKDKNDNVNAIAPASARVWRRATWSGWGKSASLFSTFTIYVCPEPVLVKDARAFIYTNGISKRRFAHLSAFARLLLTAPWRRQNSRDSVSSRSKTVATHIRTC
jgi:hypothetical protein